MTNPIPSVKPIPTPLAQRYQTYALIAWLTVLMLVTMVFLPTPRTPLTFATYQAMDQASKPIDCGLLMSDLRSADRGPFMRGALRIFVWKVDKVKGWCYKLWPDSSRGKWTC